MSRMCTTDFMCQLCAPGRILHALKSFQDGLFYLSIQNRCSKATDATDAPCMYTCGHTWKWQGSMVSSGVCWRSELHQFCTLFRSPFWCLCARLHWSSSRCGSRDLSGRCSTSSDLNLGILAPKNRLLQVSDSSTLIPIAISMALSCIQLSLPIDARIFWACHWVLNAKTYLKGHMQLLMQPCQVLTKVK